MGGYNPQPKIQLTKEETVELKKIKQELEDVKTMRQLYHCKKRVREFMQKVETRIESEKN